MNAFAADNGLVWAYTLVEKDGKFYFSAPTVTEEEAKERERWYFYPYEDIPKEFQSAFGGDRPVFVSYRDRWGAYRSIAIPERSPAGRPYLSCVDIELENLDALLEAQLVRSLIGSLLLLLAGLPFVLLYVGEISSHNQLLERMNARLKTDAFAAENRFRSLFEHSSDAVAVVDAENNITYVNPAFTALFGWDYEELVGRRYAVVPPEFMPDAIERFGKMKATGEPYRDYETRRVTKDGDYMDVSISSAPLSEKDGAFAGALLIYHDRTQRKLLEARIAQDERYRAVASLAAGAAHDFNNVLALIQGNVSLLKYGKCLDGESAELIAGIEASVKNASALTSELLGFAHPDSAPQTPVDIGALCARAAHAFIKTRPGIELFLSVPDEPLYALADTATIERVLLNLFVNADHAMEGKGTLSLIVRLGSCSLSGQSVLIGVGDTGSGMDEQTRSRIFEPFFTTKKRGKGSGLGLATSYAAVRGFGGSINVESSPGKGSLFTVALPAADFTPSSHPDSMGNA